MPKRKGKKNKQRLEESSSRGDSETASVMSDFSEGIIANGEVSLEDLIKGLLDKLGEKRLATRVGALQKLTKMLQSKYVPHAIDGSELTLASCLSTCLRSKSAKEAGLACDAIGLLAVTTEADTDPDVNGRLYAEFHKTLRTFASDRTKPPGLRARAVRTLVFLSYLTVDDPSSAAELQQLTQTMFASKEAEVTEAATSAWALVSSTIDSHVLATKILPDVGPRLLEMLDSKDLDTKQNAGRALALLYEAHAGEENGESKQSSDIEEMVDNVTEKLSDLTTTSNRSQNRKEKARQRASFREFLRTFEEEFVPQESFNVSGTEIVVRGWAKCIQIGEIRRWLSTGLQTHLKYNPLLSEIFEFTIQNLTAYEAREAREDQIYISRINSRAKKEHYEKLRLAKTHSIVASEDD
mmetsp:Transcript_21530/g.52732  ORF Transcript_21530/g.52732 Transcript_21530/m.52732 type:complete len:410 (-) Transcript_21530:225-1454(-)|eukprot:CAMPEP_0114514230 /NCGR_PEP_ID=MMETSP0109-20121206/16034_1 /TAXON_ID=29199 /ORGANISM="Chlorarachnion reptans, Strain CCCM449" /LENGTH=409 /DNA_ID=CAMNT_0001694239 /DNA_START=166 /DNA_END=1395 /DNA_ORIENTATION=-